jgi:hypothetical protein
MEFCYSAGRRAWPRAGQWRRETSRGADSERRGPCGWLESAGLLYAAGARDCAFRRFTLGGCGWLAGPLRRAGRLSDIQRGLQRFCLALDFRTGEDANSGVFIRSPDGTGGYEVQIWKAQPQGYNTGSIVGAAKTDGDYKFIPEQWNHYEITADGDHLVVVLNGTKTLDIHDSKYSNGRIRLQYQKYPIEFKNIKLKLVNH